MGAGNGLPPGATSLAWVLALAVLALVSRGLRLERYRGDGAGEARRVLLAATVAVMALRWFNTSALQGVVLHFLGATIATLMFGGRVACWMMALAAWPACCSAPPGRAAGRLISCSRALRCGHPGVGFAATRWVPPNIFTCVMANAFAAAALAMALALATALFSPPFIRVPRRSSAAQATAYLAATPLYVRASLLTGGVMVLVWSIGRSGWALVLTTATYLGPATDVAPAPAPARPDA